eukprot:scaffold37949_cov57-Phaeocystis_antarctica.AAC.1
MCWRLLGDARVDVWERLAHVRQFFRRLLVIRPNEGKHRAIQHNVYWEQSYGIPSCDIVHALTRGRT